MLVDRQRREEASSLRDVADPAAGRSGANDRRRARSPAKRIDPVAVGGEMPMIALHRVVLPMPLRPTIGDRAARRCGSSRRRAPAPSRRRRSGRRSRATSRPGQCPRARRPAHSSRWPRRGRGRAPSRWRGSRRACLRRSRGRRASSSRRCATRSAMSMSCSMRTSVIERSRPSEQLGEKDALATGEARGRLVQHQHARLARRAPSRSPPGDARRARDRRRARRSLWSIATRPAASRARSRISASRPGRTTGRSRPPLTPTIDR